MAIGKDLFELENKIEYNFSDIKNLEVALTHSSYSNEKKSRGIIILSNERLEFLGDAILEMIISEYLYNTYRECAEGILTKMRQYLVCEKTLSKIAAEIKLGDYINVGKGEENTDFRRRPKVLADTFEAVIAAIYIDSGGQLDRCKSMVLSIMKSEIENASSMKHGDYKTLLQQFVETDATSILEYSVIDESGPEHDKTFTIAAKINNNIVGTGISKSKKTAEMEAARCALELFGVNV